MKQTKWIVALAVTAVVLIAGFIGIDFALKDKENKKNIGGPKTLFSFNGDDTTRITIDNEDGFFQFDWDTTDSTWKLTSEDQFQINVYAISTICNYFCNLSSEKTVAFDCQDTSIFGFDHPITLKLYTKTAGENKPYVLYVGDSTPTYDAYYAMVEGSNDVYTIDFNSGSVFCLAKDTMKNIYLFDTYSSLVTYLRLERDGKTIMELQTDDENRWNLVQPAGFSLDNTVVLTMLDTLVRAEYTGFLEENPSDLSQYGLDKPKAKLWVKGFQRSSETSEEFWFGGPVSENANETDIYGYSVNAKQVFKIHKNDVYYINEGPENYILPNVVDYDIVNVDKVHIDLGEIYDLHSTLDVNYADNAVIFQLDDKALSSESSDIQTLYDNFYRALANVKFSELELDADPEGDAAMTFQFDMTDGTKHVLEYIPKEENNFYAMLDGKYTGMTVRLNRFTGGTGVSKVYEALIAGLQ